MALARYGVRTVIAKRTYAYGTFTVRRIYLYTYYEYGNLFLTGTVFPKYKRGGYIVCQVMEDPAAYGEFARQIYNISKNNL